MTQVRREAQRCKYCPQHLKEKSHHIRNQKFSSLCIFIWKFMQSFITLAIFTIVPNRFCKSLFLKYLTLIVFVISSFALLFLNNVIMPFVVKSSLVSYLQIVMNWILSSKKTSSCGLSEMLINTYNYAGRLCHSKDLKRIS